MDVMGKQSELDDVGDDGIEVDRDVDQLEGAHEGGSSEELSSESNTTSAPFNANQDPSESGSSKKQSNSRGKVRQYVRSRLPRLRWTADLHRCFAVAVERCGGQESKWPTLVVYVLTLPFGRKCIDWPVVHLEQE